MDEPRFVAGVDLLRRMGARQFRVGYSDPAEGDPVVWYAVGVWPGQGEAAGALDPVTAVMRLCEQAMDGGTCQHCHRPAIFIVDMEAGALLEAMGCVTAFDPELATFRRGCAGGD